MATQLNNIKISLRRDTLANWTSANPTLLAGEIAIVTTDDGENIKIGDGSTSFNGLPFQYEQNFKSTNVSAENLSVTTYVQGENTQLTDDGAFVFNGNDDDQVYTSHGDGTFNVNAKNDLCGIYIGDQSLSAILANVDGNAIFKDWKEF